MYGILTLDTRKMFPPQHLIKITFSTSVLGVIVQRIAYWLNWFGLSYPFLRFIKHRWIIPYSRWLNWESSFRLIDFVNSSFSSIDWSCPSHRLIDWSSIISMLQDLYINPSVGLVFKFCERRDRVYPCKTKLKIFWWKKTLFLFFETLSRIIV